MPSILKWMLQLALAVEYLHSKDIVHKAIQAQNIFLDANKNAKLGDLTGLDHAASKNYDPPEVNKGEAYTAKGDVWSLGRVFELLLTGK